MLSQWRPVLDTAATPVLDALHEPPAGPGGGAIGPPSPARTVGAASGRWPMRRHDHGASRDGQDGLAPGTPAAGSAGPWQPARGGGRVDPVDGGLVAAALDRGDTSWNHLVERWRPLVPSTVRRRRLQGSDAEDIVQTVWLRLVEQLGGIPQPAPARLGRHDRARALARIRAHQTVRALLDV